MSKLAEAEIARHCEVARNTLARYSNGLPVRPAIARRIQRGLFELGLIDGAGQLDPEARRALGLESGKTT